MSRERNMKWLNDRHVMLYIGGIQLMIYQPQRPNIINTTKMVRMSVITCLTARLRLLHTNL